MSDKDLRSGLIRLAHANPEIRKDILPLLEDGGAPKTATAPLPGTVAMFLEVASSKLTQYDKKMQAKQPNIYRLGHYMKALTTVRQAVSSILEDNSPAALAKLKKAFLVSFTGTGDVPDMPPIRAVFKQIDEFLATGRPPSLVRR